MQIRRNGVEDRRPFEEFLRNGGEDIGLELLRFIYRFLRLRLINFLYDF